MGDIPFLTAEQMREVDRLMVERYRINLAQMMENAGHSLAALARSRFLGGSPLNKAVVVLAGSGGNGGGALVCARRLHSWGARVQVYLTRPDQHLAPLPAHQLAILRHVGVPVAQSDEARATDRAALIVDGIIGYSLAGAPRGAAAELIRWANAQDAALLALDVPSGLDATTGIAHTPCIRADATLTLALPREGLRAPAASPYVGELYLADISVLPQLYAQPTIGLAVGPIFAERDIVRVW